MEFSLAAGEQNWAVSNSRNKIGYLTRGKQLLNEKTHPPNKVWSLDPITLQHHSNPKPPPKSGAQGSTSKKTSSIREIITPIDLLNWPDQVNGLAVRHTYTRKDMTFTTTLSNSCRKPANFRTRMADHSLIMEKWRYERCLTFSASNIFFLEGCSDNLEVSLVKFHLAWDVIDVLTSSTIQEN